MPAKARFKKLEGAYNLLPTLFPAFAKIRLGQDDTQPAAATTDLRAMLERAIATDLPRTRVILCHPNDKSRFYTAWKNPLITSFTQGEMSGSICEVLRDDFLINSARFATEGRQFENKGDIAITRNQYLLGRKTLSFTYFDDNDTLCGFALCANTNDPHLWMVNIITNTTAPIDEKKFTLITQRKMIKTEGRSAMISGEHVFAHHIFPALHSAKITTLLAPLFAKDGSINFEKFTPLHKALLKQDLTAPEPDPEILKQVQKDAKTGMTMRNPKATAGLGLAAGLLLPAAGAAFLLLGPIAAGGALLAAALAGGASTTSLVVHEGKHRKKINRLVDPGGAADETSPLLADEMGLSQLFDPPCSSQREESPASFAEQAVAETPLESPSPQPALDATEAAAIDEEEIPDAVAGASRLARERSGLFSAAASPTEGMSPRLDDTPNPTPFA